LLNHQNIIKLKEIIVSKPSISNKFRGTTFLVFEYFEHDFAGLLSSKINFTIPQIKNILKQILQGVLYFNQNKIIHRDLKSANIFLNNQGNVKIGDFGLARQILPHQEFFTKTVVTL
jgi:cyclin-dependent kinase 12/13